MPTEPHLRTIAPNLRRAGLLAIIVGAGAVLWARYGGAPPVFETIGVAVMVAGWVMYAAVLIQRARAARQPKTPSR
jgi:hypothetical protein